MNIRLKGGNQSTWRKTTQTQDATFAQRGPAKSELFLFHITQFVALWLMLVL
uniref:Uncharacterized protein n=1 Tax=Anguilla anguilla TaxID=7936 RepID=A0A0E9P7G3_ANGAN